MIYLKLHGSMNWGSSRGGDCLVIGTTKDKLIEREPFLKWCLNRFRAVLSRSKWLIVAGYGFGDKHVNDEIVNAIRDHDLSVSVILPGSLASLLDKIRDAPVTGAKRLGERVSTGAFEFCPMRVRELYHEQSGPTIELKSWFKKWGVPGSWS